MKNNLQRKQSADFSDSVSVGQVPPHSVEAEQAVLGAVLLDNEAVNSVLEIVRAEDFYQHAHAILFECMVALNEKLTPIDTITLQEELKRRNQLEVIGGIEYISRLLDTVHTAANSQYYARTIKEMSLRRRVISEAGAIATEAFNGRGEIDGFIDSVEQRIFKISDARINQGLIPISSVVKESINQVEKLHINQEPISGVPTGFTQIDEITSGFQAGELIVLAGRPGMGKTAMVLSIARHVSMTCGGNVAVFTLEMSKEQISMRMLCSEARVSNGRVKTGRLAESDFPKLVDAAARIAQSKLFVDETPAISVLEMRAKARRLHRETPLSIIIVDYLQLMRGSARNAERREQEISEISAGLKSLAKELRIPILALSQLNRGVEGRNDKRPLMSDLRESGAIEQDADIIAFIYRDEYYNPESADKGVAELIIAKHRNGEVGTVKLAFIPEYTLFENLALESDYDYLGDDLGGQEELEDDFI